jgi:octaprenyl-diphosphate synthase
MHKGSPEQAGLIRKAIENGGLEQIDAVLDAIESTGAIAYTDQMARREAEQAVARLGSLPGSEYKDALQALAEFSVNRGF